MKRFFTLVLGAAIALTSFASLQAEERLVVVEVFTSATCPPCVPAAPIIHRNATLEKGAVAIKHQVWWPAPGTDPFLNSSAEYRAMTTKRVQYYSVSGVPNALFNGQGGMNPNTESAFISGIASARSVPSQLKMSVVEDRTDPANIKVTVKATNTGTTTLTDQKLRVAVVYNHVVIPGYQGITNGMTEFHDVVYTLLPSADGENVTLEPNKEVVYTYTYTPGTGKLWPASQNYVVAYVQDPSSKLIHQGATNKAGALTVELAAEKGGLLQNNSTVAKNLTLTNPGAAEVTVKLSVDPTSKMPEGWKATLEKEMITVPAKGEATVKVNIVTNSNGGYLDMVINADPQTSGQAIGFGGSTSISGLSANTKYVLYGGTNIWADDFLNDMMGMDKLKNDLAMIPLNTANMNAYPPSNFEVAIFSTDQPNRGALVVNANTMNAIRDAVSLGKKILISSSLDLYNAFSTAGTVPSQLFFNQDLGIASGGNPIPRFTQSGQTVTFNAFPLKGMNGDPISNGIDLTLNTAIGSTTKLSTNYYTDLIRVDDDQLAKPIFTFENTNRIGGVRVENGGARIVYLSFGLEAIADVANRQMVMKRCIDWLLGSPSSINDDVSGAENRVSITPNTFSDEATLRYTVVGGEQNVNVAMFDVLGNKVREFGTFTQTAGTYELPVSAATLANGSYRVVVKAGAQTFSAPVSVLR